MKISGAIIQNRFIEENTETTFMARYKGHTVYVSSDHGHGEPKWDHLTRYTIEVTDKRGCYAVNTYDDFHTMKDAIRYALKGACLI